MKTNCLASVIIPVFNAAQYLRRCVESILKNKSVDLELILIDDGSIDESVTICKEYALKDSRVRYYKKQNGGASSARNLGLKYALGKWVTFVDADDRIILDDWTFLRTSNVDIIMFPHCTRYKHLYERHGFPDDVNIDNYVCYLSHKSFKTACSKFYRRTLLDGLCFNEGLSVGEDQLFLLQCLKRTASLKIINEPFYEYHLADISEGRKYHLTIDESIEAISHMYRAYASLGIRNPAFEADLFKSFKFLCQDEIDKAPTLWYKNSIITYIYTQIKDSLGLIFRLKYKILSNMLLARLWAMFK